MLAGFFPVRVPGSKNSFAAGEVFIFLLLLMHGPAAAALAAAGEALVGSWRSSKRWTSRIVSPALAAVAMFCAGSAAARVAGDCLQRSGWRSAAVLLRRDDGSALRLLPAQHRADHGQCRTSSAASGRAGRAFGSFGWVGIAYAASAPVACLLFLAFEQAGIGVLVAGVPIIAHAADARCTSSFASSEADEACATSRLEAAEREAAARRHATCASCSAANSASTAPSRTPRSAWRWCPPTGRVLQANSALRACSA